MDAAQNHDDNAEEPYLDRDFLKTQTYGDEALAKELLAMLDEQCERLIPQIVDGASLDDRADSAHALKGAARGLGAKRLASLLNGLEERLREGLDLQEEHRQRLWDESRRLRELITSGV